METSGKIIWEKADELVPRDILVGVNNEPIVVNTIEETQTDELVEVYNPQVSGEKNYFVVLGEKAILVHNKLIIPDLEEIKE